MPSEAPLGATISMLLVRNRRLTTLPSLPSSMPPTSGPLPASAIRCRNALAITCARPPSVCTTLASMPWTTCALALPSTSALTEVSWPVTASMPCSVTPTLALISST
ncbi:hypothetical protein D3C71_1628150 [compost metagenome]